MGKLLFGVLLIISSIAMVLWTNGILFWVGVSVLSLAGLIIFSLITAVFVKTIKWNMTLVLYLSLAVTSLIILIGKGVVNSLTGIYVIVPLSAMFMLFMIRSIASKAQTSVIFSEIFSWLTGYKIKGFIKVDKKNKSSKVVSKDDVIEDKEVLDNIVAVLTSDTLKFKTKEAKLAAIYAVENCPDGDNEEQVKCALSYLASKKLVGESA